MHHQYRKSSSARRTAPRLCLDKRMWRCTCILVLLLAMIDGLLANHPLVNTKWGNIRGMWSSTARKQPIANFLGIPYALPPLGDLRFKSPQRWNRTWTEEYDGTFDRERCVQLNYNNNYEIVGNEDCLYLNVFVPYISDTSQEKRFPVMVMVHGGGYNSGNSDSKLFAPDYLLDHQVILVTMNYRLNALGFFSTTNKVSPGNYALKDVQMALVWVQENIHNFKGNPESVTLMGHSAGAAAVHLLALSNKTERLFHRYILHSGFASSPWTYYPTRTYRQLCLELARRVGCLSTLDNDTISIETIETPVEDYTVKDDEEMMRCMRRIDAKEILKMAYSFYVWRFNPIILFGPTLEDDSEDAVLTMHPLQIMKAGLFRDIPAIMQVVQDEGLLKSLDFFTDITIENELIENFEEYLPSLLEYENIISNTTVFARSIEEFYFNGNVTSNLKDNITELLGDALVTWPAYQALQYQSKFGKSNIYFSLFAYEGTFTNTFVSGIPIHYGVTHTDDLNYIFPILNHKFRDQLLHNTESDITMINIMTEMWTSFAKTGVPRARMVPAWPDYRDHHEFMRFGNDISTEIVVQTDFLSDRMEFWEKLMANMSAESIEHDFFPLNLLTIVNSAEVTGYKLTVYFLLVIINFCLVYK